MTTKGTIIQDRQSATAYDEQARKTDWFGPEVVFGLAYEFVQPGQALLDLGIGSGLSSIPFHKASLRVFGLDGSSEILEVCAAKNFTEELKEHDLRRLPLPYADRSFEHVISVAVLNSFRDLAPLFAEVSRLLKADGIFAFTVEEQKPGMQERYPINRVEVSEKPDETAVMLFRHSAAYLAETLAQNGFESLKTLEFVAFKYPAENRDVFFKAYVARRAGHNLTI